MMAAVALRMQVDHRVETTAADMVLDCFGSLLRDSMIKNQIPKKPFKFLHMNGKSFKRHEPVSKEFEELTLLSGERR